MRSPETDGRNGEGRDPKVSPLLPVYSSEDERLDDFPNGASTVQAESQERPVRLTVPLRFHDAS